MRRRHWLMLIPLVLIAVLGVRAEAQNLVPNSSFEEMGANGAIAGWTAHGDIRIRKAAPEDVAPTGEHVALLEALPEGRPGFTNLVFCMDAEALRGTWLEFSAMVRVAGGASGRAQLWMRVDRPGEQVGFFDNMSDRPIRSAEWSRSAVGGKVADDAVRVCVGVMVFGAGGRAFVDDARLETIAAADTGNQAAAPITPRGEQNLAALAELSGVVRFFHPSDEAAGADWASVIAAAAERVEAANDAHELAQRLEESIAAVAPTVQVWDAREPAPPPIPVLPGATRATRWVHVGLGEALGGNAGTIYRSTRRFVAIDALRTLESYGPAESFEWELPGGVKARVPVIVLADDEGTIPSAVAPPLALDRPARWRMTPDDRAVRLATVLLAWSTLKHAYPYHDLLSTSWDDALGPALRRAATDADAAAFGSTLRRLVAALEDGHGFVTDPTQAQRFSLPVAMRVIEGRLIVVARDEGVSDPSIGDEVIALNGVHVAGIIADVRQQISAAAPGWMNHRVAEWLSAVPNLAEVVLEVRSPTNEARTVTLRPRAGAGPQEARPRQGEEIAPGVRYVNLNQMTTAQLRPLLQELASARGVVFDMRGYPDSAGIDVIRHLTRKTISSPTWRVPQITAPGDRGMRWLESSWDVGPGDPAIRGRAVFITDGRAISYAETCMQIVENYALGDIVGEPTAATNGNVQYLRLPGGFGISFTGMLVRKHDGSRFHGIGVLPTHPVSPTVAGVAAGRDELLEAAAALAATPRPSSTEAK